jgi:hypothetical protein
MIFQIGFNKCGTTSLYWLFKGSGYKALHSGGRRYRRRGNAAVSARHPQLTIFHNISAGLPPVTGLSEFSAFFDMEYNKRDGGVKIENFKFFDRFASAYPNARFILNVRDKRDWLRSREAHSGGFYMASAMKRHGYTRDQVTNRWGDEFDRHNDAVRTFFAHEQDRMLEFHIKNDPIENLVSFCAPLATINGEKWGVSRRTLETAAA